MDRPIQVGLERVAMRFRLVRLAWLLSLVWACLSIAFGLMLQTQEASNLPRTVQLPYMGSIGLVSACWYGGIVAAVVLGLACIRSYRNELWTARRIEASHPDLKQRLLTLLDPRNSTSSPFLRKQLLEETVQHATNHRWANTVPSERLVTAWTIQLLALTLAFYAGSKADRNFNAFSLVPIGESFGIHNSARDVEISPGDIELERGTDLVVTARFPEVSLPQNAWIESQPSPTQSEGGILTTGSVADSTNNTKLITNVAGVIAPSLETIQARIALERSLSDPVFGGYLRRIGQDLDYKVTADGFESIIYKIKVFDYPSLVRSDAVTLSPSYAAKEGEPDTRTIENTRRITVAEGSQVTWRLTVNKPLVSVSLDNVESGGLQLLASDEDPLLWAVTLTANRSMNWELKLVDEAGRQAKFPEKFHMKVLPNAPPLIQLGTAQDITASPLQELVLNARVKNEFGVKKTGVTISKRDTGAEDGFVQQVIDIVGVPDKKGFVDLAYQLDLEKLRVEPDDLISYFFWAEDIDVEGETRRTEGDMFFVEVRPFEEIFREGDSAASEQQSPPNASSGSQAAEQAENLAELQKKIISGTWNLRRKLKESEASQTINADSPGAERESALKTLVDSQQQALQQTSELESTIQDSKSQAYLQEIREAMRASVVQLEASAREDGLASLDLALVGERQAYEGLLKLRAREHSIVRSRQQSQSSQSRNSSQQNRQDQVDQLELDPEENNYQNEQQAAESEPTTADREARQVMNRLDELARRQQDINEQLKQMETAIQEAKTPEEKEELEEQLKRLRENQEELLRDTDELLDKMNQPENRQAMQESREQVEQARDQLQQSTQSLSEGEASSALNSGSRAQRQLDETREQLRQDSSSQLQQNMQDLVEQARRIESEQKRLEQAMNPQNSDAQNSDSQRDESSIEGDPESDALPENASPLRPGGVDSDASQASQEWSQLKTDVDQLLEEVKQIVQESETTEPILAEKLYETYRDAKQNKVDEKLDHVRQLLNRGLTEPARRVASDARPQIERLRNAIETASEDILGSEQESLRRALRELAESRDAMAEELVAEEAPSPAPNSAPASSDADSRSAVSSATDGSSPAPSNEGEDELAVGGAGDESQNDRTPSRNTPYSNTLSRNTNTPLSGNGYQRWSDRLREAEELLRDQELKTDVSRIRESAREMRIRYRRTGENPDAEAVQKTIMEPLAQLQRRVSEELLRRAAEKNSLVPIDRDPVPKQFQRKLDSYYENLGRGAPRP